MFLKEKTEGSIEGRRNHIRTKKGDFLVSGTYDIIVVGGGLGRGYPGEGHGLMWCAFTCAAAVSAEFRDLVRGEVVMASLGAAEAWELGIYKLLLSTCGRESRLVRACLIGPSPNPHAT